MKTPPVKTLNGRPTAVSELNVQTSIKQIPEPGLIGRIRRINARLNQVLAGMYTGVTCYGVPHEEHGYREDRKDKSDTGEQD